MTHLELLNRLPSPYDTQAIENCKVFNGEKWLLKSAGDKDLADCIYLGFPWNETPKSQGEKMWRTIYAKAILGEFDDPSVTLPREDWEELIEAAQKGRCANKLIKAIQSQLNQTK